MIQKKGTWASKQTNKQTKITNKCTKERIVTRRRAAGEESLSRRRPSEDSSPSCPSATLLTSIQKEFKCSFQNLRQGVHPICNLRYLCHLPLWGRCRYLSCWTLVSLQFFQGIFSGENGYKISLSDLTFHKNSSMGAGWGNRTQFTEQNCTFWFWTLPF